jgi:hypothetical protein
MSGHDDLSMRHRCLKAPLAGTSTEQGDGGLSNTLGCEGSEVGGSCDVVLEDPAPTFPLAWCVLIVEGAVKGRW